MTFKFIKNPKTGKLETITDTTIPSKQDLEKLRKEVKDMIAGNAVFHIDPYTEYETYYQFGLIDDIT